MSIEGRQVNFVVRSEDWNEYQVGTISVRTKYVVEHISHVQEGGEDLYEKGYPIMRVTGQLHIITDVWDLDIEKEESK